MTEDDEKSWNDAVKLRGETQNEERDARLGAIEEAHFNADEYGHWDEYATKRFEGQPRYQTDLVKPIIDSIAGEIEQQEIGGQVVPVGGDATIELAETYERMVRTISNMSDAADIYSEAVRNVTDHAYDAWMLTTDYEGVDSFDQDILIEKIPDSLTRVWIPGICSATKPEDVKGGFVDTELSLDEYNKLYPDRAGQSLSDFGHNYLESKTTSSDKKTVTVSDYYYIKDESVLLHLLSDNRVVTDEEYQPLAESLAAKGVVSSRQKTRKLPKCYMRKMDGEGWLAPEEETVFRYVPLFQAIANFQVISGRPYYRGETRKLMDPQRIYDYGTTKDVLDGALGRKDKIAATQEQVEGHEDQNRKLNVQDDPLFLYSFEKENMQPPPYVIPGSQVDVGLQNTLTRTQMDMKEISMSHNPQQGAGLSGHSGKAYEILNEKSNTSSYKYIKAVEKAVGWTYKVIIDAIPRVYDKKNRQVRLTNEDGTSDFVTVNQEMADKKGQMQVINDLAQGSYMFKVKSGPAYSNRRSEGLQALKEWAALDPSLIEEGKDIFYKMMNAPGVKDIAERVRKRMIEEGRIPEGQLTDDEKEKIMAEMEAAANQPPNPMDEATVAAIMAEVKNILSQIEEREVDIDVKLQESERKMLETMAKIEQGRDKLDSEIDNKDADTLAKLRDATGAEAVVNTNVIEAYDEVAEGMTENTDV